MEVLCKKLDKISGQDNIDGGELMKFVRAFQSDHLHGLQTACKFIQFGVAFPLKGPFLLAGQIRTADNAGKVSKTDASVDYLIHNYYNGSIEEE